MDEALELADQANQWDMQEKMLRLGIESPYAISAELLTELTGLSVSDHSLLRHYAIRRLVRCRAHARETEGCNVKDPGSPGLDILPCQRLTECS
jgi:hypothetical protein